jgi:hypothetical protein
MGWWPLTRDEALDQARRHIESQGLPFEEPVSASRRPLGGWSVMTNAKGMGGNVFVEISRSGRVSGGERVTPR